MAMNLEVVKSKRRSVYFRGDHGLLFGVGSLLLLLLLTFSCHSKEGEKQFLKEEKQKWENKIDQAELSVDSLKSLLTVSIVSKNHVAVSVLCKELGGRMRIISDFDKAIEYHQQGLEAAYIINDTIGITQALNNIATDFRRMGALPEASEYHYQALHMAENFSGRGEIIGRKNRVIAINGLGNVYLSFGNLVEAETMFRQSLAEEIALESDLGQAINYANIGAIFEKREMYDSAYYYYERSMERNIAAGSRLGIGLCHIYFGRSE